MKITLQEALKFTLKWEGNYTDHPNDLGGPTNKGIIQKVYDNYRKEKDLQLRSVQFITDIEVYEIYEKYYWEPVRAKWLSAPLALTLFDTAVNFGVSGAIRRLQKALKLKITGSWNQDISDVIHKSDARKIALDICNQRITWRYHRADVNKSQKVFLRGWLNRDNDLIKTITNIDSIEILSEDDLIGIVLNDNVEILSDENLDDIAIEEIDEEIGQEDTR